MVSARDAVRLMGRQQYVAKGTLRRVKQLWEMAPAGPPRLFPIDMHHWDGRGCMKFWADQRSPGGHAVAA